MLARAGITMSISRALRDPEGFWAEAAQEIDWYSPAKSVFDGGAGVYGRWFVGATCNTCYNAIDRHVAAGRANQTALIYDSPGHQHQTRLSPTTSCSRRSQRLRPCCEDFGVSKGDRVILYMPMVPGSGVRHARLRAHRRHPFGRVRRLRGEGTRDPHRRLQAEADPVRVLRHRAGPRRALQAAARPGDRARASKAAKRASSCSGRRRRRRWSPAAITTGPRCAMPRCASASPRPACRCSPPIRSIFSTRPARRAFRKASCATMAATWSRSNGR